MRALVNSCTLKPADTASNAEALAEVVMRELRARDVEVELVRAAALSTPPGVETDLGSRDGWLWIHGTLLNSEILIVASPTWESDL